MACLELKDVAKSFTVAGRQSCVLENVNLAVEEGEFIAIVGFSGSGKTTLVSLIAGLTEPDAGTIALNGQPIPGPGPDRGVVFQSYSLLPWASVYGNIALAVDAVCTHESRAARDTRTRHYIDMVGLGPAIDRRPAELSGGMRQRVALARALAMDPDVLLLDEPLSALDALTRARLQGEIERIYCEDHKTVVMITNDVDEAVLLADRIIPLTPGPGATLGPAFQVAIARPRDRTALNHDPRFQSLRNAVTRYLIDAGEKSGDRAPDPRPLPNVVPIEKTGATREPLPRAYAENARSPLEERYVEFFDVRKTYPTPAGLLTVVDGFDLLMRKGEFISLIGHSGCGKSTVLSMAAGLVPVSDGGIVLDNREVVSAGPDRAVVFQAPSLFPWLTVRDNVALGVDNVYPHAKTPERRDIVDYYLARVGLGDAAETRASDLSAGMKQRVGIARAFALSPKLLLLDEPFGMLDSLTRWELQEVLMDVWRRTQVTAICVTHDVDEAILLGDRVVMMTNGPRARIGRIVPIDIPRPRTRKALLAHPHYYAYREEILTFLAECEYGAKQPAPTQCPDDVTPAEDAA